MRESWTLYVGIIILLVIVVLGIAGLTRSARGLRELYMMNKEQKTGEKKQEDRHESD